MDFHHLPKRAKDLGCKACIRLDDGEGLKWFWGILKDLRIPEYRAALVLPFRRHGVVSLRDARSGYMRECERLELFPL